MGRMVKVGLKGTGGWLNEHMVKNAYPFPLILTLINKLKGAKFFSKMDVQWGDRWKATFITPYRLYEPLVMFFGQCNLPPTFQAFMDSAFRDMIMEGWLVIYMDDDLVFVDTEGQFQE